MKLAPGRGPLYTTKEFERWWEKDAPAEILQTMPDHAAAKLLAWEAWKKGREQMSEATAHQRLQPVRR